MYALVEDIEAYPAFLPWCTAPRCTSAGRADGAYAHRRRRAPAPSFTRRTTIGPARPSTCAWWKDRSAAAGRWRFAPLAPHACRIEFSLSYEFSSRALGRLLAPLFDGIADSTVEAFVRRAAQVYED